MEVNGRRVTWREPEAAGPGVPVLFAHCSMAHSGLWKPMLAELAPERRAVSVDMPAHGGSEPPPEGIGLQMHALDACEALAERMVAAHGGPIHLVGLSLGGAVLGRLALARPELARSLTQIEPVWFFLLGPQGETGEAAAETEFSRTLLSMVEAGDLDGAAEFFVNNWGAPGGYEALGPEGRAYAARCVEHLAKDMDMVHGRPPGQLTIEEIARMRPPLTLIGGAESPPSAGKVLDVIEGAVAGARRVTIPGAGHLSPVTHWPEVLAVLRESFEAAERAA
ncbi:MAG: alpha/beta hydrolase [Paracoccaceae bacterium]